MSETPQPTTAELIAFVMDWRQSERQTAVLYPTAERNVVMLTALASRLAQADRMEAEIEAVWTYIANGYSIEPRGVFEREAPTNGFTYPLAQAIHHIWKREPKVADLQAKADRMEQALRKIHELVSPMPSASAAIIAATCDAALAPAPDTTPEP